MVIIELGKTKDIYRLPQTIIVVKELETACDSKNHFRPSPYE
jgi:hypothetical protein